MHSCLPLSSLLLLDFRVLLPTFIDSYGVCDEQGGLACCDSWGRKESDTTERLN